MTSALDAAVRRFPFLLAGARRYGHDWTVRYVIMRRDDIVEEYRIQCMKERRDVEDNGAVCRDVHGDVRDRHGTGDSRRRPNAALVVNEREIMAVIAEYKEGFQWPA